MKPKLRREVITVAEGWPGGWSGSEVRCQQPCALWHDTRYVPFLYNIVNLRKCEYVLKEEAKKSVCRLKMIDF